MAASATFALKVGVWFRRGRLFMVSPDSLGTACPLSGRNSTYRPVQIFETSSALGSKTIHPFSDFLLHDVGTGDGIALGPAEHCGPSVARRLLGEDAERLRGRLSASALDAVVAGGNSQEGTNTPAAP